MQSVPNILPKEEVTIFYLFPEKQPVAYGCAYCGKVFATRIYSQLGAQQLLLQHIRNCDMKR